MEEETTEDIHSMAAVAPLEQSYIDSSVGAIIKSRLPWLMILLLSATFTGSIISGYETQLAVLPALATFIPMLMDTSGDAGSQASTMVIRSLAVDGLKPKNFMKVLGKEVSVSVMCGIGLMLLNVGRIMLFNPDYGIEVALTMSFALFCTVVMASILGGTLPLVAVIFKLDPASVVSPMITAIVDALSLIVYFEIAVNLVGL
jgi:magnesium transporter